MFRLIPKPSTGTCIKSITDQNHIVYKKILLKWIDQDVKLTDIHVSLLHVLAKTKLGDKYVIRY